MVGDTTSTAGCVRQGLSSSQKEKERRTLDNNCLVLVWNPAPLLKGIWSKNTETISTISLTLTNFLPGGKLVSKCEAYSTDCLCVFGPDGFEERGDRQEREGTRILVNDNDDL
jgi:hypothetical protein